MGGKVTEDIMPNEIKKPLDKFANKFGDMFVPKELAKPLMMAAPYLGPIAGPIAAAAGSAKEHGGIDMVVERKYLKSTISTLLSGF